MPTSNQRTIVLLHGVGASGEMWSQTSAALNGTFSRVIAPDLPGHGSASDESVSFRDCGAQVLARAPARFVLAGYSLGGRIAQQIALSAPERIERLILISTSPGIEDRTDRERRLLADDRLATEIERLGIEKFAQKWVAQPLFANQPRESRKKQLAELVKNDPACLANAMRSLSVGRMDPTWSRLTEIELPCSIVVGEYDLKYVEIGRRMADLLPKSKLAIVADAGHGLPREQPRELARLIVN